jgi:hypothetical protein
LSQKFAGYSRKLGEFAQSRVILLMRDSFSSAPQRNAKVRERF